MKINSSVNTILLAILALQNAYAGLLSNSPFLPPEIKQIKSAPKPKVKPATKVEFEFKGVIRIGNDYMFSLVDKRSQKQVWLNPNESINGFKIISYDRINQVLNYEWNGQAGQIAMEKRDEIPLSVIQNPKDALPNASSNVPSSSSPSYASQIRPRTTGTSSQKTSRQFLRSEPRLIVFQAGGISGGSASNSSASNSGFGQISPDTPSFADPSVSPQQSGKEGDAPNRPNPLSIFPVNKVHNPDGKRPNHHRYRQ